MHAGGCFGLSDQYRLGLWIGIGSGGTSGTINSGNGGQIAYYTASGTTIGGMSAVVLNAGGTGATSASGAMANLLPGVASDGNNGIKVTGNVAAGESLPATSPYADIRAYGAAIDGATPINTALAAAQAVCPLYYSGAQNGASCSILIPAGGTLGALLGPTSTPLTPLGNPLGRVKLQGKLQLSSTLVLNGGTIEGDCGGGIGSLVDTGCTADIVGPNVYGTLGTAITVPNVATQIAPVFGAGSLTNLIQGSSMHIADLTSCTASVTLSGVNGSVDYYIGTCSGRTDIPPEAVITVTGCSNSAFNTSSNGASVNAVDWPNNIIAWFGPVGTAGSTTGCTITGLNYDTYEGVEITGSNGTGGCPSGDICFVPAYVHGATAEWGEDAVRNPANNFVHAELLNVNISQSAGAQLWAEGGSGVVLDGVTLSPRSLLTSIAADYSSGQFQGSFTQNSEMDADINFAPNCGVANTCGNTSFPAGLLCDQLPSGTGNGGGNGCPGFINNTIIDSAIYTRATSDDGDPGSGIPSMDNVTIQRSNGCGVFLDSRYGAIYGAGYQSRVWPFRTRLLAGLAGALTAAPRPISVRLIPIFPASRNRSAIAVKCVRHFRGQ